MKNETYKQWIEWNADAIKWIIDMAEAGIKVSPGAGDHPANVLLHGLKCQVNAVLENQTSQEGVE